MIDGKVTKAAFIKLLISNPNRSLLEVVLQEGRNRQIRKVADLLSHPVIDLKRIAIADIKLNSLAEGKWREIKEIEWKNIFSESKVLAKS